VFLAARRDEALLGSIALRIIAPSQGEMKRLFVQRDARGIGLGRRLLAELEHRAASVGAPVVRLDTNRVLTEAIAMYRAEGYREIPPFNENPYAHHWFEKTLDR
jgi:GNAT superfamily N-acetyltransferase